MTFFIKSEFQKLGLYSPMIEQSLKTYQNFGEVREAATISLFTEKNMTRFVLHMKKCTYEKVPKPCLSMPQH